MTEPTPTHPSAARFVEALSTLESSGDAGPVAQAFTDDATLERMTHGGDKAASESATEFWVAYRGVFGEISSTFTAVTEDDARAVLEWRASGTRQDGESIEYRGVSVLDLPDGDGPLTGFRTYYDSAAFTQ